LGRENLEMKIAFIFTPSLLNGRTLDLTDPMSNTQVATGSEITMLALPIELAKRGHNVRLLIERPTVSSYRLFPNDIPVPVTELKEGAVADSDFDVALALTVIGEDIQIFRNVDPKYVRVCLDILNAIYISNEADDAVDLHLAPSEPLRQRLMPWGKDPSKWEVLPLGCYPDVYPKVERVSGRCVYISSPDRGLHHVLTQWGEIKSAVPHAELRIFYNSFHTYLSLSHGDERHRHRVETIKRLVDPPGVAVRGGVSRNDLAKELAEAEVLAFPCDTVAFSEGFSCSTLEGCASGALPIISGTDALGEIYRGATPIVSPPIESHLDKWTSLVIRALTVPPWAESWRAKAKQFAASHAWPLLAERLETILERKMGEKR
jgi:hypothetical protein